MKTELATSILVAVAGVLISFFVCNLFIGEIKSTTVKTINAEVSADLDEPDPEVFNNKALNPTVEVYVGSCAEYSSTGECINQSAQEELEEVVDQNTVQTNDQFDSQTNTQTNSQTNTQTTSPTTNNQGNR